MVFSKISVYFLLSYFQVLQLNTEESIKNLLEMKIYGHVLLLFNQNISQNVCHCLKDLFLRDSNTIFSVTFNANELVLCSLWHFTHPIP